LEHENWEQLQTELSEGPETVRTVDAVREFLSVDARVKVYRECGFEVPLTQKEALVGMMDRLEVDEAEQRIRVIDYKYTARSKSKEALLSHYGLQLRLYAWAASKMVSFKPARIEAFLVHFTGDFHQILEADPAQFQIDDLQAEVQKLFERAKSTVDAPKIGDYCRYCEWTQSCPPQKV
jgi:ATP-dependent exoDNAse (exonuclease V) beta subunit